jgi:hypothetical protein
MKRRTAMRRTNEELDDLIAQQESQIAADAAKVDITRGHVGRSDSQLLKNRAEAIRILEGQKEATTVNLRAGI